MSEKDATCPACKKKVWFLATTDHFIDEDNKLTHLVECIECEAIFVEKFKAIGLFKVKYEKIP